MQLRNASKYAEFKGERIQEQRLMPKKLGVRSLVSSELSFYHYIKGKMVKICQEFKTVLDEFLSKLPDQLTVPGRARVAETNSLLHQIPLVICSQMN
jgi:hypothetical protein